MRVIYLKSVFLLFVAHVYLIGFFKLHKLMFTHAYVIKSYSRVNCYTLAFLLHFGKNNCTRLKKIYSVN